MGLLPPLPQPHQHSLQPQPLLPPLPPAPRLLLLLLLQLLQPRNPVLLKLLVCIVGHDRCEDGSSTADKLDIWDDREKEDRVKGAEDDRDTRGKPLEDVVCIFDNEGDDEAAEGGVCNDGPDEGIVPVEEALVCNEGAVVVVDASETKESAEGPQLDVADPDRGGGALEDHLKVDGGKTREKACDEDGREADDL